jgi:integrase
VYLSENPAKSVKALKEENRRERCLTLEEIRRLLGACADHLRPIVVTALNTGMRCGEIRGLRWEHVHFPVENQGRVQPGYIELRETKSGRGRKIPMTRELIETLKSVRMSPFKGNTLPELKKGSGHRK